MCCGEDCGIVDGFVGGVEDFCEIGCFDIEEFADAFCVETIECVEERGCECR